MSKGQLDGLDVLYDYGDLVVTLRHKGDSEIRTPMFNVTHKKSGCRLCGWDTLGPAKDAAEAWADLGFWDFDRAYVDDAGTVPRRKEIAKILQATPQWKGARA